MGWLHLVALEGGAAQRVRQWSAQQHAQTSAMWCISAFLVTTCAEVSFCVCCSRAVVFSSVLELTRAPFKKALLMGGLHLAAYVAA